MKTLRKEWAYREYVNREDLVIHAPYEPEMDFYNLVASGNETEVKKILEEDFLQKKGLGKLSNNMLRNGLYHFAITAALIARNCIKNGMSVEEAYSLSDFYIQKADRLSTTEAITKLHDEMVLDYTNKMFLLNKPQSYSRPVIKCINYIYSHLHVNITLTKLSRHVMLSENYLSRLFKKETGQTVTEYISSKKIETAKNMLEYSDYTISEIALILCYPSQSYFTECFRKATGTTPLKYRTHSSY